MSARQSHSVFYLKARQQPKVAEKQNKTEQKPTNETPENTFTYNESDFE